MCSFPHSWDVHEPVLFPKLTGHCGRKRIRKEHDSQAHCTTVRAIRRCYHDQRKRHPNIETRGSSAHYFGPFPRLYTFPSFGKLHLDMNDLDNHFAFLDQRQHWPWWSWQCNGRRQDTEGSSASWRHRFDRKFAERLRYISQASSQGSLFGLTRRYDLTIRKARWLWASTTCGWNWRL